MPGATERTVIRTCPLCEATCGLELTCSNGSLLRIRGDDEDVFSHGFICPKGDDRSARCTTTPTGCAARWSAARRRADAGTWEEAFAEVDRGLPPIIEAHGRDAVARLPGQPERPQPGRRLLYGRVLLKALRTRNIFSASTVDQRPKELSSALMFGTMASFAGPGPRPNRHTC